MTTQSQSNQPGFEEMLRKTVGDVMEEKMSPDLEPITPKEAVDKYFETRDFDRQGTINTQKSSLENHFIPWCEEVANIDNMNDLRGSDLADYRIWRREEAPEKVDKLQKVTEASEQQITRKFIEVCESFQAVIPGLHEYVLIPEVNKDDEVREQILDTDTAKDILAWLQKYEYGSVEHIVWLLFSECGARVSGVRALDETDFVNDGEGPRLEFRHRPDKGTGLKNGSDGKRDVHLSPGVCEVLEDYIADNRISTTDEYGRDPLLTTSHGRLAKSTIRNYIYAWTRPCAIGNECPYNEEPDDCRAARRNNWAYECPGSMSCHPVRKGYITAELEAGVPIAVLSERCDVAEPVLSKHYDFRTEKEKMSVRRKLMEVAHETGSSYAE